MHMIDKEVGPEKETKDKKQPENINKTNATFTEDQRLQKIWNQPRRNRTDERSNILVTLIPKI